MSVAKSPVPSDPSEPSAGQEPNGDPHKRRRWITAVLMAVSVAALLSLQFAPPDAGDRTSISYSRFYDLVEQDRVESVHLRGKEVRGEAREGAAGSDGDPEVPPSFRTRLPQQSDDALLPALREHDVTVTVESAEEPVFVQALYAILPWVLLIGLWIWLSRRARQAFSKGGGLGNIMDRRSHKFDPEKHVPTSFDDVAGLKNAKRDLREVIQFLREPDRFARLGGRVPHGVLLVGPPGTGKTLLARAVAGEAEVPFFYISGSEFIQMFVGVGASRVRELFDQAKKSSPAIVFIDEIDTIGRARGTGLGGGHDEREQTLNQLLAEMDGFTPNERTVVLAATNRPDVLDKALLRPGRFDRQITADRPELPARVAILQVHTKDKPLADEVDLDAIARQTPGFAGADLANLCNEAALHATRRRAEQVEPVDFSAAMDKVLLGDERETVLGPGERRRIAVHESGHALVAFFSEHAHPLRRVTIIPRGQALGATQQIPLSDQHLTTQAQAEATLRVLMGGSAAEQTVLDERSSGAEDDYRRATAIATKMVAHWGMTEELGPVYYRHDEEHPFLGRHVASQQGVSDRTTRKIEQQVRGVLLRAQQSAAALIGEHREALDRLILALLERETLEDEELVNALHPAVDQPQSDRRPRRRGADQPESRAVGSER